MFCLNRGLVYRWTSLFSARMMVTGYKRPLEERDLWSLNAEDCSHKVVPQLVHCWNAECQKVKRSGENNVFSPFVKDGANASVVAAR